MSESKTKPTDASVRDFLDAVEGDERRTDCQTLPAMMGQITDQPAIMWGSSIVGVDSYHYRYASGREGDMAVTGFSPRKGDLSIYFTAGSPQRTDLLARLGRHTMGKACLYIRRLADIELGVLRQLISASVAEVKRRHG